MTFGIQKSCTQAEFQEELEDLYSACHLKDVGTYYFTFGEQSSDDKKLFSVYLKFYDKDQQTLHTSSCKAFHFAKKPEASIAIDRNTFIVGTGGDAWDIVTFNNEWSKSTFKKLRIGRSELAKYLSSTPKLPSLLSKLRNGSPGDFHLKSTQGDMIEVHTTVLVPLWSFFAAAINSEMKEAVEKVLQIQCPTSTLEIIVRHIYDQDLELQFEDAANLVVVAQMYNLSELLEIAVTTIKNRENTFDELLTAWEKSQQAQNEELKRFCAKGMLAELVESEEKVEKLKKEDLLALFMDVARLSKGEKEEGKK